MASIQERLGVPEKTKFVEATYDNPDPFYSHPIAIKVTPDDVREAKRQDHFNCAIACAIRNSSHAEAAAIQSRAVYLLRRHPKTKELIISKHQLTAAAGRLVRKFDRTGKAPSQFLSIIPLAPSHTKSHRAKARGTGSSRGHGHAQKPVKRPKWLRSRLAPRMAA